MKRLIIYLAVTFGLTWGLLIPAGLVLKTFESGESSSMVMIGLIAVSMFFPLVGALVANSACKSEERINLCLRPRVKQNVRHYLAAWFLPAAFSLLGCVVFFASNPSWFDPTMSSYVKTMAAASGVSVEQFATQIPQTPVTVAGFVLFALMLAPLVNVIPSFGEEVGWRGMLYPTLTEYMSCRAAAVVSGAIWGLWHAPVIAMGHNYGMQYVGFPVVGILTMIVACTALTCWLSYLREKTGSVWPCALAHGAVNATANVGLLFCTVGPTFLGPSPLGLIAGLPMMAVGIICLAKLPEAKGNPVG